MIKVMKYTTVLSALALAAACRAEYETPPVTVQSENGPVTCQLYTVERVMWDQATQLPDGLTQEEGDAICRAEGYRQKKAARKRS